MRVITCRPGKTNTEAVGEAGGFVLGQPSKTVSRQLPQAVSFCSKKFLRLMIYGYQNSVGPSLSRQQPSPVRCRPSVSLTAQPDPHLLHRDEHQLLLKPEARVWRAVRPLSALKKDPGLRSAIDFSSSSKAPDYIPCPLLPVRLSL